MLALGLASCTTPSAGGAASGGDGLITAAGEVGPAPSEASLTRAQGPMAIGQQNGNGDGFNSGTIFYPSDTSIGQRPAIVIVPGFISNKSSVIWYGRLMASWGFIAMVIDTNTPLDFPAQRANQQNAALKWLTTASPVASRTDPERLGAMGWSMGGGGTLDAARQNPAIKAAIPLAPWEINSYANLRTPTLVISCTGDTVAPPASMGTAFYNQIQAEKAQLLVSGQHFCVTNFNAQMAKYSVAWMKVFLDGDTRFEQFACSRPSAGVQYKNTCPLS
jgi:dienelactone hydrolase